MTGCARSGENAPEPDLSERTEQPATRPTATAQDAAPTGSVSVDPSPSCGPAADRAANSRAWLDRPGLRERAALLERELAPYAAWKLGSYPDDLRQAIVVVFHQSFRGYDEVRERLARITAPLPVVLRPACYSPEQIAEAQKTIEQMDWHPEARRFRMAAHLDPSFSGFMVTIDESAPEVADALRARLGPLVHVRLGKPHG